MEFKPGNLSVNQSVRDVTFGVIFNGYAKCYGAISDSLPRREKESKLLPKVRMKCKVKS